MRFDPLTATLERDRPADVPMGAFAFDPLTAAIRWALGIDEFSPSQLFAAGEQGVWYDPSDFSTMFQDSAGTTPVTAIEQPVGLMLDKSKGLALGNNLIVDGGFDNPSGWTIVGTGATISGGVFTYTDPGSGTGRAEQNSGVSIVSGRSYKITFTISGITSGTAWFYFVNQSNQTVFGIYTLTTNGTYTYTVPAQVAATKIAVAGTSTGSAPTFSIDNVSVQELPGNHASQSTTTSRPILRNRYNLLTYTEQLNEAAWSKINTTTATASSVLETTANGAHSCTQSVATVAASYTYSVKLKANGRIRFAIAGASALGGGLGVGVFFDLSTGSYISGGPGTPTITALTDGWYQVSYTWLASAASGVLGIYLVDSGTNLSYAGDTAKGMFIKEASLVLANEASIPYQRVTTGAQSTSNPVSIVTAGYDTDTTKFKPYLFFDGSDDWLQTGNIDFSATDKMSVFAGVRKLSDLVASSLIELSATGQNSNGAFGLLAPLGSSASSRYAFGSKGVASSVLTQFSVANTGAAPDTAVLTGLGNISGDSSLLRRNGFAFAPGTADQGTGNFGAAYPIYIGRRGGTTQPFSGRIYSLIIRGALTSSPLLEQTETWVNSKTGAY